MEWNVFFYCREEKGMNCFKRITYVGLFIYDFHALNSFINYWKLTSEIYLHRKKWNLLIGNIFIYRIYIEIFSNFRKIDDIFCKIFKYFREKYIYIYIRPRLESIHIWKPRVPHLDKFTNRSLTLRIVTFRVFRQRSRSWRRASALTIRVKAVA